MTNAIKCTECHGIGRIECGAYYYGVAECSFCQGLGYIKPDGEPFAEEEWEAFLADPDKEV